MRLRMRPRPYPPLRGRPRTRLRQTSGKRDLKTSRKAVRSPPPRPRLRLEEEALSPPSIRPLGYRILGNPEQTKLQPGLARRKNH